MAKNKRPKALVAWLNAIEPNYGSAQLPLKVIGGCFDIRLLVAACQTIDETAFAEVARDDEMLSPEERQEGLNRLLYAIEQYFRNALEQSRWTLPPIDVEGIASETNTSSLVDLLAIIISMAVLSPSKERQIEKIQSTPEWVQKELMLCIEEVRSKLPSPDPSKDLASSIVEDSSDSLASYIDLHAAHRALQNAHEALQQEVEILKSEHEDALRALRESQPASKSRKTDDVNKAESLLKSEVDRLQLELAKSEQIIANAEQVTSQQHRSIETLTKQVEELLPKAEQTDKLKDEMDEYRHAAEKARKLESSVDKYKKKLEEATEAKRSLKALEEENLALLDKNTALEAELQNSAHYKTLIDSHKNTIASLETKAKDLAKDKEALQLTLETNKAQIAVLQEERSSQLETVALLEERVEQLEAGYPNARKKRLTQSSDADTASSEDEESINDLSGVANEIDDAISGVTTAELKLQIRKLKRELEAIQANKTDSSRISVLENLLDDAQKMKARYEQDILTEHKEKLVLQRQLDEIRQGASRGSNDAEANIALRIHLGETTEELKTIRRGAAAVETELQQSQRELKLAQADLALVDKSQSSMLAEVRKTVSAEQGGLESELDRLREELKKAQQTASMQMSQINSLLLDKVDLQGQGIAQRDAMLQRQSDQTIPAIDATLSNEDLKARAEQLEQVKEQLKKARIFIRQQDKLFKEQHQARFNAANGDRQHEIETLKSELIRQKTINSELEQKYENEKRLLLTAFQEAGLERVWSQVLATGQTTSRTAPISWLSQQRARALHYT